MIAATQRQTAAPVANVKSEIHMRASLVLFSARGHRGSAQSTPSLNIRSWNFSGILIPFSFGMEPPKSHGFVLPSLKPPHLTAALPTFDVV
jgi:hypothetical protein